MKKKNGVFCGGPSKMGTWFLCVILTCKNQIKKDTIKVRCVHQSALSLLTAAKSLTAALEITHITK